jgi:hypothetical protein
MRCVLFYAGSNVLIFNFQFSIFNFQLWLLMFFLAVVGVWSMLTAIVLLNKKRIHC